MRSGFYLFRHKIVRSVFEHRACVPCGRQADFSLTDKEPMRFAIATVDGYLGVFTAFVHAGWTPVKLFSVPVRNEFGNQQAVIAFAEQNKAAIQLSRMNERDLQRLRDDGCEILIVASYDWKIPTGSLI